MLTIGLFGQVLSGEQEMIILHLTVSCVTLSLLYVGRNGERSLKKLLWL